MITDKYYARKQYMQQRWDRSDFISGNEAIKEGLIERFDEEWDPVSDMNMIFWNENKNLETAEIGDLIVVDGEEGWNFYIFDFEVNNSEDQIIDYKWQTQTFEWDGEYDDLEELKLLEDLDHELRFVIEVGSEGRSSISWLISELEENSKRADQFVVIRIDEDDRYCEYIASWLLG